MGMGYGKISYHYAFLFLWLEVEVQLIDLWRITVATEVFEFQTLTCLDR